MVVSYFYLYTKFFIELWRTFRHDFLGFSEVAAKRWNELWISLSNDKKESDFTEGKYLVKKLPIFFTEILSIGIFGNCRSLQPFGSFEVFNRAQFLNFLVSFFESSRTAFSSPSPLACLDLALLARNTLAWKTRKYNAFFAGCASEETYSLYFLEQRINAGVKNSP